MRRRVLISVALAAAAPAACFARSDAPGLPQVRISFPATVTAGATEVVVLEVTNPGPRDMTSLVVSFGMVGVPGERRVTPPLVPAGFRHRNPAVVSVAPAPRSTSLDGWSYSFPGVAEGDTATIEFEIRVPRRPGVAANAVVVSDGADEERVRGVRLLTRIRG